MLVRLQCTLSALLAQQMPELPELLDTALACAERPELRNIAIVVLDHFDQQISSRTIETSSENPTMFKNDQGGKNIFFPQDFFC